MYNLILARKTVRLRSANGTFVSRTNLSYQSIFLWTSLEAFFIGTAWYAYTKPLPRYAHLEILSRPWSDIILVPLS